MLKTVWIMLACLLLLLSCATETDIDAVNEDGSPIWTTMVPESNRYVYGIGRAKLSNEANSISSADAAARADLARKLQSTIKEATVNYTNDAEGDLLNAYEQITMQVVEFTIQGVKTEQHWSATDGTVWSLVSVEAKKLDDQYALAANDYVLKLESGKAETEARLASLLEMLDAQEGDTSAVRAEAKRQADELIRSYDSQLSGLDVNALAAAIDSFTTAMGYV